MPTNFGLRGSDWVTLTLDWHVISILVFVLGDDSTESQRTPADDEVQKSGRQTHSCCSFSFHFSACFLLCSPAYFRNNFYRIYFSASCFLLAASWIFTAACLWPHFTPQSRWVCLGATWTMKICPALLAPCLSIAHGKHFCHLLYLPANIARQKEKYIPYHVVPHCIGEGRQDLGLGSLVLVRFHSHFHSVPVPFPPQFRLAHFRFPSSRGAFINIPFLPLPRHVPRSSVSVF